MFCKFTDDENIQKKRIQIYVYNYFGSASGRIGLYCYGSCAGISSGMVCGVCSGIDDGIAAGGQFDSAETFQQDQSADPGKHG